MRVCHCYGRALHDVYVSLLAACPLPQGCHSFFGGGGSKLWEASTPRPVGLSGEVALCYSDFLETSHDLKGSSRSALAARTFCKVPICALTIHSIALFPCVHTWVALRFCKG